MPRKKKKEKLNIKSTETKIFSGLILFVLGLSFIMAPFVQDQTPLFVYITKFLGWPSIVWGISILYISLNFLTKGKKFNNWFQFSGIVLISICLNTLFTFWLPEESLINGDTLNNAGGLLGKSFHLFLNGGLGDVPELLIILVLLIAAFSLATGVKLEEISEVVEQMLGNIKVGDLKTSLSNSNEAMEINSFDDDRVTIDNTQENEVEFTHTTDEYTPPQRPVNTGTANIEINTGLNTEDQEPSQPKYLDWRYPGIDMLQEPVAKKQDPEVYKNIARTIKQTLKSFGIEANVAKVSIGPTVTQYALGLAVGTKVAKIKNLSNDIALSTQSSNVRIEAPIPGTPYVGIEVPNPTPNYVYLKEMARKLIPEKDKYELPLIMGKDIAGNTTIKDLAKIPHILVAGATGTGKSVGINTILAGLLLTKTPDEVKFIMVDPKMGVEMAAYNGIPHLLNPVITDMELVVNALQWTIDEMMRRYRQLKQVHAKKLTEYNAKVGYTAMPYIVVVIDEMADLMLTSGPDVETKIQRLAQMGRAVGIHLILATQKPTVNVITGLIKSNVPGRIAFAVATAMDSRVILDQTGAEDLLGSGDMLFKDQTMPKAIRVQCAYTSTEDTEDIIRQIKDQVNEEDVEYSEELTSAIENTQGQGGITGSSTQREPEFEQALEIAIAEGKISASFLQRRLKIGYNKAARLMENLEEAGAVGKQDGSKPREILVSSKEQILGADPNKDLTQ